MNKFKDGTIEVLANAWPTFLYEHDVYDPDDLELGLMRGALLVRVSLRFSILHAIYLKHCIDGSAYIYGARDMECRQSEIYFTSKHR